tara:strand:- start:460 stop:1443 length:984 start_codon:yes stop_codon:yes gene_type:complete
VNLIKKFVVSINGRVKPLLVEWMTAVRSFNLHARYSFSERSPDQDIDQLRYYLIKHCHIVEKGMALPKPREAFGQPKIKTLIKRTKIYESRGGEQVGQIVRDTLQQYREMHKGKEKLFEPGFIDEIDAFINTTGPEGKGGLKWLSKSQWDDWSINKFNEFLSFRHSVRDFDSTPVEPILLKSAIAASLKTPSVCNRQGWFIHYYDDKNKMKELLSYQNGNAGFTDCIDKLIIVTGNLKAFTRHEHSQLFVDGGLVSMNLMLAIHAAGLGSCPLNTCMDYIKEKNLMSSAGIADNERLVMMIAVGNLKDKFSVAQSERFSLDDVLIQH